ncbi:MAG: lipocalin-like domain-containing protein [Gammaproteobacteria bacterium]
MRFLRKMSYGLFAALFMNTIAFANLPYHPITFPRDEAAHYTNVPYPVTNMTEWWYYNGKFTTMNDRNFGYCIFYLYAQAAKNGNLVRGPMVYFLLADIDKQIVYKFLAFDLPITKLNTKNLDLAFGNNFTLQRSPDNRYAFNFHATTENGSDVQMSLTLEPSFERPVMLNGKTGLINMWNNTNSYYYSRTNLKTINGDFAIDSDSYKINPAKSLSWMDHQWGDFMLNPLAHPWVWTSIQLDNGLEMNIMGKYHPLLNKADDLAANVFLPNGAQYVYTTQVEYTPAKVESGQFYPESYTVNIKSLNLSLKLESLVPGQYIGNTWEGVSSVTGKFQGQPVKGQAYTENTSVHLQ